MVVAKYLEVRLDRGRPLFCSWPPQDPGPLLRRVRYIPRLGIVSVTQGNGLLADEASFRFREAELIDLFTAH